MRKTIFFVFAFIISLNTNAQTFSAIYTFDSVKTTTGLIDPTPLPAATGIVFNAFSAVGTPVNPNASARFSFTNWAVGATSGDDNFSTLTGLVDTAEYYAVTISPASGYTLSLSDLTFRVQRSGTGIRTYAVRSSVDNFTANLFATINPANTKLSIQTGDVFFWNYDSITTAQNGSTVTLGGTNYTNITSPITFRFYAWNAEGSIGTFSIDNVTMNGSASIIGTAIEEAESKQINIFPNPSASGLFTIKMPVTSKAIVTIYNSIGERILQKEINGTQSIDVSDRPNGSYFVVFQTDKEAITQKVIIVQ